MRVDVEKKNPALESLFTDPEQTIFLDANFFIPPDRSRMGTKPIPFLKFCEIWLDPIFDAEKFISASLICKAFYGKMEAQ